MGRLLFIIGSRSLYVCMIATFVFVLFSRPVQAEWYVAGQVGANLPADFSNVRWSAGGAT